MASHLRGRLARRDRRGARRGRGCGHPERARPPGDPPRGETAFSPHPRIPVRERARRVHPIAPESLGVRGGAAAYPEGQSRRGTWPRTCATSGQGRRRRGLPRDAALLRERAPLAVRRAGARGGIGGAHPARPHALHQRRAGGAVHRECAGRPSPPSCGGDGGPAVGSGLREGPGRRLRHPAERELLRRGAPGVHFYTLNRSSSTRAILAALRASEPWRHRD